MDGTSTGLTVNGTSLTLTDDDDAPAINLSVNPASVAESAGATAVTVTATFSNSSTYAAATPVTVGDAADSAVSGTDYAAVASFTVTIPAGASSGSTPFTLSPVDDALIESNETITVSGSASGLTVNGTSLALPDNDVATVTVSNARAVEGETMTFTLTLDRTAPGSFTVTPVYHDDTATKDQDYTANTTPVAFTGNAGE